MAKKTKLNSWFSTLWIYFRNFLILFFAISTSWVILARFIPILITPLMVIRSVEAMFDKHLPTNEKTWVSITDISTNMPQAVVASEDNLFMSHHGFSFTAIEKAIQHNQKGKRIRGGSTISQQTAKNVFLWPHRSYIRKGLEAYFTVLIELFWTKERIMEVYLNVIETGNGVYGVEAASQKFFGKSAAKLTKGQAALIAASLPNPRKFRINNPSGYLLRRQAKIISLMGKIKQVRF
ncbi:MAG: monofunctional biosynthetic peptidoglycan transglycosylase [Porphyromonadaceae bacterium CG2_30_38_12]|nr:MAG: monofunctional biosynthetic peptidoglycan transglycosylase [Porphyromonadaceae bacterium CG2_30_38_12]